MGIREQKERGNLLKSTNPQLVESDSEDEYTAAGGSHSTFKYAGTEFEQSVQAFLSQHVDTTETFLDKHRSMFNQQSMREVRVSVIGPGCTHGEVDAFKERPYLYSLRTVTSNCVVYEVDSSEALMVIKTAAKDKDFRKYSKNKDQETINLLAVRLFNAFRGMNIDNNHKKLHAKAYGLIDTQTRPIVKLNAQVNQLRAQRLMKEK